MLSVPKTKQAILHAVEGYLRECLVTGVSLKDDADDGLSITVRNVGMRGQHMDLEVVQTDNNDKRQEHAFRFALLAPTTEISSSVDTCLQDEAS